MKKDLIHIYNVGGIELFDVCGPNKIWIFEQMLSEELGYC